MRVACACVLVRKTTSDDQPTKQTHLISHLACAQFDVHSFKLHNCTHDTHPNVQNCVNLVLTRHTQTRLMKSLSIGCSRTKKHPDTQIQTNPKRRRHALSFAHALPSMQALSERMRCWDTEEFTADWWWHTTQKAKQKCRSCRPTN